MDFKISKMRTIFQPIMQILIFILLHTMVWNFLKSFDLLKKHELWDLTTIYLFGCITLISLISGILLLIFRKIYYSIIILLVVLFAALTFNDFKSSPKIILITWFEAGLSILIANVFFVNFIKNR